VPPPGDGNFPGSHLPPIETCLSSRRRYLSRSQLVGWVQAVPPGLQKRFHFKVVSSGSGAGMGGKATGSSRLGGGGKGTFPGLPGAGGGDGLPGSAGVAGAGVLPGFAGAMGAGSMTG
jgi:hypothetical protein